MKPNPIDMLMFLDVVETRSFTAAAERLGRTKSALSQAVARLEQDLGCRLLYRSTRSLSLTDSGAQLLAHCQDIRQVYETAQTDLRAAGKEPTGRLSVTAPHALCASVISSALARFVENHPTLSIRLVADDAPIDLIERQIDLAVRIGTPSQQTARLTKIGMLSESLYASPDYLDRKGGPPATLASIADWDFIANEWQGTPITYTVPAGETLRLVPRIQCNTVLDVLRMTEEGTGVAMLPDIAVRGSKEGCTLSRLFPLSATPIYAVHQFESRPPAKVTAFVQILRAMLSRSEETMKNS